jgi:hypothetical protein
MQKTIITLLILEMLFMLISCNNKGEADYSKEVLNLQPKQVIEYYVKAINEQNALKIYTTLAGRMKMVSINYSWIKSVKINSINIVEEYDLPETVPSFQDIVVYKVVLDFKSINSPQIRKEFTSEFYYFVCRENQNSAWLIYDVVETQEQNM